MMGTAMKSALDELLPPFERANGHTIHGLQQVSELMSNPEVGVIRLLPPELQQITIYSAGITTGAKQPDAARALIRHIATAEAKAIYKAKGLELQ